MTTRSPFRYFKISLEIIRLAVMLYIRLPLSLRIGEDLLHERGIEVSHGTVRFWWRRFGPMFAAEIRKRRAGALQVSCWRWHLDEVLVRINGVQHYLWRDEDHGGEVLEAFVSKRRDKVAALKFLKKPLSCGTLARTLRHPRSAHRARRCCAFQAPARLSCLGGSAGPGGRGQWPTSDEPPLVKGIGPPWPAPCSQSGTRRWAEHVSRQGPAPPDLTPGPNPLRGSVGLLPRSPKRPLR